MISISALPLYSVPLTLRDLLLNEVLSATASRSNVVMRDHYLPKVNIYVSVSVVQGNAVDVDSRHGQSSSSTDSAG